MLKTAAAGIIIATAGHSPYRVVIPANPTPSQAFAASELVRFVAEMSGAELTVMPDSMPAQGPEIILGNSSRLQDLEVTVDWRNLGDEGYRILTVKKNLVIAGSGVRGTLYGVYGLLSDHWGCRWYTPEVSLIPKRRRLSLPRIDKTTVPRLEYRESYWWEGFDGDWAARNRQNSALARLEPRHGGKVQYKGFVHTMDGLVPTDLYEMHPEYFAMRAGKRVKDNSQRCLTNPEVLNIAIENARKWLRESPDATIISVSQNDNSEFCECPKCKAVDDAEGSHAGTMLAFANNVAAAIEAEFPKVAVDTLAYQYTRTPPKTVKPRPNVIVRLCSIECCFSHPLDECSEDSNRSFMRDLTGWGKLSRRLYIWDYVTNFKHYLLLIPNLGVLDENIRVFVNNGVAGVFEEGNYSEGGGGELAPLKAWVLARVLVDPDLKAARLIQEYVYAVYGPAAGPVMDFINRYMRAIKNTREHVRIYDEAERNYLYPELLREYDRILDKAETLAVKSGDQALVTRVVRLRMPIWYAQLEQAREPVEARKAIARRLLNSARSMGITRFCEWRNISEDFAKLEAFLK